MGGERVDGEIGLGVDDATGAAGLNGHHADGVGDDVVQLTGYAGAFGDDCSISEQTLLALKERVALLQIYQSLATLAHVVTKEERRAEDDHITDERTDEISGGDGAEIEEGEERDDGQHAAGDPCQAASCVGRDCHRVRRDDGGKRVATRRVVESLPQDKHDERDDEYR